MRRSVWVTNSELYPVIRILTKNFVFLKTHYFCLSLPIPASPKPLFIQLSSHSKLCNVSRCNIFVTEH
jgi:hypothetical protein